MKYRIIQEIEIRSEPSFIRGRGFGTLRPGFIVDIVGEVHDSDNIWLKDVNEFYYWKGGLEEAFPINSQDDNIVNFATSKIPKWNSDNFDVTRFWPYTTGKGVKVAVIDSGIYPHKDLLRAIDSENQKTFAGESIEDTNGHGTHVAGIIAARGVSDMYGLAPESIIIPIKIGEPPFKNETLSQAVSYASSIPNVRIINLSVRANGLDKNGIESLRFKIENAINNGKIVVAAAGDNYRDTVYFPARFKKVIAVSSAKRKKNSNQESYVIRRRSNYGLTDRPIDTCAPGVDISSCANMNIGTIIKSGTSMSAAFISGLLALKLEKSPSIDVDQVLHDLKTSIFQHALRERENSGVKIPVVNPKLFLNL